jgi:Zn-finger nucleic acid-binding protein
MVLPLQDQSIQERDMKCPHCTEENLLMTVRDGVEIDYCPICRGVWLDRGELDKIIERAAVSAAPQPPPVPAQSYQQSQRQRRDDDSVDEDYPNDRYRRKKRGGWLGELLDFD